MIKVVGNDGASMSVVQAHDGTVAVTMVVLVLADDLRRIRQVVLPPRWLPECSLCVEVVH